MQRNDLRTPELAPEGIVREAGPTLKKAQLRLLMKEREEVASKLVEIDYTIWTLEEYFRAGSPE